MEIDPTEPEAQIKDEDLFRAADSGDSSVFRALSPQQLLRALSLRNEDDRSLLHVATSLGHLEVVKMLSEADPSVSGINSVDEEGWAPLHSAASSGHTEIVEILISRGADVNLKNDGGRTALHYAASKGWLKIAEFLILHNAKINAKDKAYRLHPIASSSKHRELSNV
ncbi:unnamed protein product, partial [Vitis vinifera]